jgi:uncharacterized protein (UPF0332 family)
MSLQSWADAGWLTAHTSSAEEVKNLLAVVERDLQDAAQDLSPDWKLGIAYNAALRLCTLLLHVSGYRAGRQQHHYRTIQSLPLILGETYKENADYLDACRRKRNTVEYDLAGAATNEEAEELISFATEFRAEVLIWLRKGRPDWVP